MAEDVTAFFSQVPEPQEQTSYKENTFNTMP
jgi:hypothetical protein